MSAGIQERDKQFGVEMGWHGLTHIVETLTPEIVYPWGIKLAQVYYGDDKRKHGRWVIPMSDDDDLPLGSGVPVNLETYTIRTPHELWELRNKVVENTENQVVSAGSVNDRSRFFISTKLTELERLKFQDGSEMDLLLNSMGALDKTLVEQHSISGTRIVCNNTLMMSFFGDKVRFRFRHSKKMKEAIDKKIPLIQEVAGLAAVIKAAFNGLIDKPCDVDRAERIYTGLIVSDKQEEISKRASNLIEQHVECFQRGDGNQGQNEFDLLNGFTQLKTRGYADSKRDRWSVFESSEFGAYANQKARFASLLVNKDRTDLNKVEERGRNLLSVRPVEVTA